MSSGVKIVRGKIRSFSFHTSASLLALLLLSFPVYSDRPPAHCELPRSYRIVRIDEAFGLTRAEVSKALQTSARMWQRALGREVFYESDRGEIAVSLEFGKAQSSYLAAKALQEQGELLESDVEVFNQKMNAINRRIEDQNQRVRVYEQELVQFNNRVSAWNNNPGPFWELRKIRTAKEEFDRQRAELEQIQKGIDKDLELLERERSFVEQGRQAYNQDRNFFETVRGGSLDFQKAGLYLDDGRLEQIKLYMFANTQELQSVFAHELGHALGLGHVSDANAIMHEQMSERNLGRSSVSRTDLYEFQQVCEY